MPTYTAPHRTPTKRTHLPRRAAIVLTTASLLFVSLLAISRPAAHADPSTNPIFATLQEVQNAINAALAPITSTIASLQQDQASQATTISNLQVQVTKLSQSIPLTVKSLSGFDEGTVLPTGETICGDYDTNGNVIGWHKSPAGQGCPSSTKGLKVLDANGTELGTLVDHDGYTDKIYSPALSKFIYIADNEYEESTGDNSNTSDSNGIANKINPLYYQSSDCTGTPYLTTYNYNANNVMSFSPTEYYVFHISEPASKFTLGSIKYWNSNSSSTICVPDPQNDFTAWQLYPVSLPFPTPIAEPLQFKYQ